MRKVTAGDPLVISPDTFNTFVDAARDFVSRRNETRTGKTSPLPFGVAWVRNDTGDDLDANVVVSIVESVFSPDDNLPAYKDSILLSVDEPTASLPWIAITREPIRDGAIGLATISGFAVVKVSINSETDAWADRLEGDTGKLSSASSGQARIISRAPEGERTGTVGWCLVEVSPGGGGSVVAQARIESIGTGSVLNCRLLKADGRIDTAEDTVAVLAKTYGTSAGSVGNQTVSGSDWAPPLAVGEIIDVEYRTFFKTTANIPSAAPTPVVGYVTVDGYMKIGCTA